MKSDKMAVKIERHFQSFGIVLKLILLELVCGGSRLIFDVKVKKGTKINQLFDRANDIRVALGLPLFQLFWEGQRIRLAVSDRPVTDNSLREMLTNPEFRNSGMKIPIALGFDMRGKMFFTDLITFVHAMYGGGTNSGKTVGLRSMVMSIATLQPVSRVNLIIIDTYTRALKLFNPLPHLVLPVVDEIDKAISVLQALVLEMERRLTLLPEELRLLPAIVCVIDEYINLIKNIGSGKSELIAALTSLLRLGRQAKVHVILATQEPGKEDMQISLNNVNGRMAFRCSNFYNSVSILGCKGAETLPGSGTMYFKAPGQDPIPLQGSEMKPAEIEKLVAHIASRPHDLSKKFDIFEAKAAQTPTCTANASDSKPVKQDPDEKELADIILWALGQSSVSADKIKQRFRKGNRAYDIADELCAMNIITEKFANQPRAVRPASVDDVPAESLELLAKYGITADDVAAAISGRDGGE